MFLFNFALDDQKTIFILSIAFVLLIILIWVIVAKIVKSVKADKAAEKAAKENLASLGFKEFEDNKKVSAKAFKEDSDSARDYDDVDAKTKDEVEVAPIALALEKEEETPVEENTDTPVEEEATKPEAEVVEEEPTEAQEEEAPEEVVEEATEPEVENTTDEAEPDTTVEAPEETTEEVVEEATNPETPEEEKEEEKPKARKKGRTYNGKYEIFQTADGYAYNLKASNGEVLVTSETYTTRDGVIKAINAVKRNLETGEVRIFADKRGQYKFKLVSRNYRILAISSNYSVEKSAIRASESFKKFALKADMVDVEIEDKDAKTATPIDVSGADVKKDGKFVVEKFNGEYSWALKASNGQILCQAEGYTSKAGCMYSIETFKRNVADGTFKCVKDKTGNYQYKLYNVSGRICAVGESYQSKVGAESAARSVVSFYSDAAILEVKETKEPKAKK